MSDEPKTKAVIFTRRGLYFCVPFTTTFATFLSGAQVVDARTVTAALFASFAAGGAALLAAIEKTEPVKAGVAQPKKKGSFEKLRERYEQPAYVSKTTTKTDYTKSKPPPLEPND